MSPVIWLFNFPVILN